MNTANFPFLFKDEEAEIELNLGSIKGSFWGENISMVSAIVGKNGTGKTSILTIQTLFTLRRVFTFIEYLMWLCHPESFIFGSISDKDKFSYDTLLIVHDRIL